MASSVLKKKPWRGKTSDPPNIPQSPVFDQVVKSVPVLMPQAWYQPLHFKESGETASVHLSTT